MRNSGKQVCTTSVSFAQVHQNPLRLLSFMKKGPRGKPRTPLDTPNSTVFGILITLFLSSNDRALDAVF